MAGRQDQVRRNDRPGALSHLIAAKVEHISHPWEGAGSAVCPPMTATVRAGAPERTTGSVARAGDRRHGDRWRTRTTRSRDTAVARTRYTSPHPTGMSQASAQTPEKPPDRIGTNRRRLKLKIPFVAGSIRIGFWDRDDLAHELADTRQAVRPRRVGAVGRRQPRELDRSSYVDGLDCVVAVGHRKADVDDAGPGERVAHPESAVADVRGRELVPRS